MSHAKVTITATTAQPGTRNPSANRSSVGVIGRMPR
jgi:hypothetical protein